MNTVYNFIIHIYTCFSSTVVLSRGDFAPQRHMAMSTGIYDHCNWGQGEVLLAPTEWKSGMLPSTLQCTGSPLSSKQSTDPRNLQYQWQLVQSHVKISSRLMFL
jgi:hypothetical protein